MYKLGIIGAGNMSNAICRGILFKKVLNTDSVVIGDKDLSKLNKMKEQGFNVSSDNKYIARESENLLFAIKPQNFKDVANEIKLDIRAKAVISIMAGIPISSLVSSLNNDDNCIKKFCRIMPNTPCMIGEGISAITFLEYKQEEKQFVFDIFNSLGETIELDEKKFDSVTAVSGSGPAYVYTFIQSIVNAGVSEGLSIEEAKKFTISVFKGASKLAEVSELSLPDLITAVTSKGGTTEAALNVFAKYQISANIEKGVIAASKRSKELGKNEKS